MQVVVETPPYLAVAERLFTVEERATIVDRVAADPRCGVVIPDPAASASYGLASATVANAAAHA